MKVLLKLQQETHLRWAVRCRVVVRSPWRVLLLLGPELRGHALDDVPHFRRQRPAVGTELRRAGRVTVVAIHEAVRRRRRRRRRALRRGELLVGHAGRAVGGPRGGPRPGLRERHPRRAAHGRGEDAGRVPREPRHSR